MVKIAEGVLAAIFGLALSYLVVVGLDRLGDTPAWLRTLILLVGMVGMVVLFPIKYHNWVWRRRRLNQVARLLREKYPRFGDHVLGVVELAYVDPDALTSRVLVEAAMKQVDDELEHRTLDDAVPNPRHRRWTVAVAMPMVLIVTLMWLSPHAGRNAFVRWLTPWRDVERYTFAKLEGNVGPRVVPYAEPFNVDVRLKDVSPWKPASGKARYARQESIEAPRDGLRYAFTIPPQTKDGSVYLSVGDARRTIPVEPKMRPELTEILARIQLPAYLQLPDVVVEDVRGGSLSAVKGSSVAFQATATRELATATMDGRSQRVEGNRILTQPRTNIVADTSEYVLAWRDRLGLDMRTPQVLRIDAHDDAAPKVSLGKLKNNMAVVSTRTITFDIRARDDFGVERVGIEWEGVKHSSGPSPAKGEKPVSAGSPTNAQMAVSGTFSAQRENVPPQSLRIRAFAEDYMHFRERSYSAYVVIHILSPEQHSTYWTELMGRWVDRAKDVYDTELQLHRINKELHNLPPGELDKPENRRKLQKQAAQERANAAKLSKLTDAGKDLLREAGQNKEIDPNELEKMAQMIKKLEAFAKNKMPDIAEMLAKAADAPGKKPEDQPPPTTSPSPPVPPAPEGPKGKEDKDFNKLDKPAPPIPPPPPKLGLPSNTLKGSMNPDDGSPPPQSEALVAEAIKVQKELLDAFAKLADEMNALLANLENSTFVKRLKAASARQLTLAADLSKDALHAFGVATQKVGWEQRVKARGMAEREVKEARHLDVLMADLDAYTERKPSPSYSAVLEEMKVARVSEELSLIRETIKGNYVGMSVTDVEFWADTLDRWAEQLVPPLEESASEELSAEAQEEEASLTPEIVLEVMRILDAEITLREETRELQNAKDVLENDAYKKRGGELAATQRELAKTTGEVINMIGELPEGQAAFGEQMLALAEATEVMVEAAGILARPHTGRHAIAAETEVIELLLESQRAPKPPPPEMKIPAGKMPALAMIGRGNDAGKAFIEERDAGSEQGATGRELPEEFRYGLDKYFGAMEGTAGE